MSFATGAAVFNSCNKAGAVGYFTRHLETNPRDWNALMWRAEAYSIIGQPQNAAKDIARAIEVSSGVQRKLAMAEKKLYDNVGVSDLIRTYKGIVDEHSDCWKAWNKLGCLQKHTGDIDGAMKSLRNAVDVATKIGESKDPGVCWIHLQLGLISVEKGDIVTATDCFKSAIESSPTHTISHINLCEMNLLQGKVSDARQNFSTAIGLNPKLVKEVCGSETFDGYLRQKVLAYQNMQQASNASTSTVGNSHRPSAPAYAQNGNNGNVSRISNRRTHQSPVARNTRSGSSWGIGGIQNFVNWVFGWDNQSTAAADARGGSSGAVGGISTGQRHQSPVPGNASRSGNSGNTRPGYQSSVNHSSRRINSGGVGTTSTRQESSTAGSSRSRNGVGLDGSSTRQGYQSPIAGSSRSGNYGRVGESSTEQRHKPLDIGSARKNIDSGGASRISTRQGYQSPIPRSAGRESSARVGGISTLRRYTNPSSVDALSNNSSGGNNDGVGNTSAAGRSNVRNHVDRIGSSKDYRYQSGSSGGRGGNNGGGGGSDGSGSEDDDFTSKDVNQIWKELQKEAPCIKMYKKHKYVQSKCGQFWYSRDTAGHGRGSYAAFKRYDNTRSHLHFKDSLDENMRPMTNKHESRAGTKINKNDMIGVRG